MEGNSVKEQELVDEINNILVLACKMLEDIVPNSKVTMDPLTKRVKFHVEEITGPLIISLAKYVEKEEQDGTTVVIKRSGTGVTAIIEFGQKKPEATVPSDPSV